MEVDGTANSVVEVDVVHEPMGLTNPQGNAYTLKETILESEAVAKRLIDPFVSRSWKVINPSSVNHMGAPVGYKLIPTGGEKN